MTREEYMMCQLMASYTGKEAPPEATDFYRAAGYTDDQINDYKTASAALAV